MAHTQQEKVGSHGDSVAAMSVMKVATCLVIFTSNSKRSVHSLNSRQETLPESKGVSQIISVIFCVLFNYFLSMYFSSFIKLNEAKSTSSIQFIFQLFICLCFMNTSPNLSKHHSQWLTYSPFSLRMLASLYNGWILYMYVHIYPHIYSNIFSGLKGCMSILWYFKSIKTSRK